MGTNALLDNDLKDLKFALFSISKVNRGCCGAYGYDASSPLEPPSHQAISRTYRLHSGTSNLLFLLHLAITSSSNASMNVFAITGESGNPIAIPLFFSEMFPFHAKYVVVRPLLLYKIIWQSLWYHP